MPCLSVACVKLLWQCRLLGWEIGGKDSVYNYNNNIIISIPPDVVACQGVMSTFMMHPSITTSISPEGERSDATAAAATALALLPEEQVCPTPIPALG